MPQVSHNFKHTPRLGTRGSLLATTQSGHVRARLLELSGIDSELQLIKTQGDQITDKPLWQLDGKDFFTKELDQALLGGQVDFVVHSLKDLSTQRPEGIFLAAVTKRLFPNDILLCRRETAQRWGRDNSPKKVVIGTSSPRRIANSGQHLASYLPYGHDMTVELKNLRGNVNTRLEKMLRGEYDAIILAMTGMERLCQSHESRQTMAPMLAQCEFMLLPQSVFPTAAGQGALGIECRQDDLETRRWLALLHDQETAACIAQERQIFRQYGGGCHLAVGIHVRPVRQYLMTIERGIHQDKPVQHISSTIERPLPPNGDIFVGMPHLQNGNPKRKVVHDRHYIKQTLPLSQAASTPAHCFISVAHAIDTFTQWPETMRFGTWAAGTKTHQKLARRGHWVHASAEGLGEDTLKQLTQSLALQTIHPEWCPPWLNFGPQGGRTTSVAAYQRRLLPLDQSAIEELRQCQCFFWSSFAQYQAYCQAMPELKSKMHCSGPGKTYDDFLENKVDIQLFVSLEEFKLWSGLQLK